MASVALVEATGCRHFQMSLQCAGAAIASIILKGLDSTGYKAAAGASNQINAAAGATIGRALGFEIVLTYVSGSSPSVAFSTRYSSGCAKHFQGSVYVAVHVCCWIQYV